MKLGETLYVKDRKSWRAWLAKNHKSATEIWLVYYRKETGKPRIPYNHAVEEALCYGWIDSIIKKLDEERFAQRFSRRKPGSVLSQANLERLRRLCSSGKMTRAGLAAVAHAFDPETDAPAGFAIPPDILAAIMADKDAWQNFQKMPDEYRRVRVAYIQSRARHGEEQYARALRNFVRMTAKNRIIGFVR